MQRMSNANSLAAWFCISTVGLAACCGSGGASSKTGGSSSGATSGTTTGSSSGGVTPIGGDSVLMHHKNPNRDGLYVNSTLTKAAIGTLHADPSFATTNIVGNVYAQPLFVDAQGGTDLVIIATESDNVYALDAATGAQVWMTNVGTPVPLAMLPCGNIDPVGITGTPVIDPATRTLFFDAELLVSGASTHRVFALSLDNGSIRTGWPVDIPMSAVSGTTAFQPAAQGERGALAVLGGSVYVPYGGRYGDCSPFHGWVVGINISNPAAVQAWSTTASAGGSWMPSGIASDGTSLFVSTGNTLTSGAGAPWGGGDAFVSLAPGAILSMQGYFAPKNWFNLDNSDLDMGTGPVLLDLPGSTPSALAILFGKDGNAYLVDRNNPGGVGSALGANAASCTATNISNACASLPVASDEIISASTVYSTATATYVVVRGNGKLCTGGTSG
ncbi:MAG TPA: hypothetical protein VMK12_02365, partial [Anaeromyxobacteraceae bacterium]|nr:hypothetical protein [Anaeromyxobacteraceae bacterium]